MAQKVNKSIMSFAVVAFVLLGVLFGMNIMTFLFGNIGIANVDALSDTTVTVLNEEIVWINASGYPVDVIASDPRFNSGVAITSAVNRSDQGTILVGNYTVTSGGNLTSATATTFANVSLNYTYSQKTEARVVTENVNNNSLEAVSTYSQQAGTQFSTVAIAMTLIILLAVFAFFWAFFIGTQGKRGRSSGGNFS